MTHPTPATQNGDRPICAEMRSLWPQNRSQARVALERAEQSQISSVLRAHLAGRSRYETRPRLSDRPPHARAMLRCSEPSALAEDEAHRAPLDAPRMCCARAREPVRAFCASHPARRPFSARALDPPPRPSPARHPRRRQGPAVADRPLARESARPGAVRGRPRGTRATRARRCTRPSLRPHVTSPPFAHPPPLSWPTPTGAHTPGVHPRAFHISKAAWRKARGASGSARRRRA